MSLSEIDMITINGHFKCLCGTLVYFQMDSDEYAFPECEDCVREWKVSVDGDIDAPTITVGENLFENP